MGKTTRNNRTLRLSRRSTARTGTRMKRRRRKGAFTGYKPPLNGDRELRGIMKAFVRTTAGKKGLSPEEYERGIRRDGTYSALRRMCHKLLFLVEKVCDELRAQEKLRRRSVLSTPKDAAA